MAHGFQDWLTCPECDESDTVSTLAHKTDIIFECYECGLVSEFAVGDDIPIRDLDLAAIADLADEQADS